MDGQTPEVIAKLLNVRYLISGSVISHKAGLRLSLAANEMPGTRLVWTASVDLTTQPTPIELRDAAQRMVNSLAYGLDHMEQQRALIQQDMVSLASSVSYRRSHD